MKRLALYVQAKLSHERSHWRKKDLLHTWFQLLNDVMLPQSPDVMLTKMTFRNKFLRRKGIMSLVRSMGASLPPPDTLIKRGYLLE